MPSRRSCSGRNTSTEALKSGFAKPRRDPGVEIARERLEVRALVREVRGERLDRRLDLGDELPQSGLVGPVEVDRAVGSLMLAQLLDRVAEPRPGRIGGGCRLDRCATGGEGRLGGVVDEVDPEGLVVERVDAVVAEQVGVGEDDDAAGAVGRHRGERCIRRRSARIGTGEDPPAVGERQRAGPVEAGLADTGKGVGAAALGGDEVREDPARRVAAVVHVVLDGRVLDLDPEAAEQFVEVVAVLLLLGLAEDDQPAARLDPGDDRLDLLGAEARLADAGRRLPARLGGMGDDEHVGAAEGGRVERRRVVGGDLEVTALERGGGSGKRRVGRMGRLHPLGDLGADRPRLRVGLVEEDPGASCVLGRFHALLPF